jgi:hypothetical protein
MSDCRHRRACVTERRPVYPGRLAFGWRVSTWRGNVTHNDHGANGRIGTDRRHVEPSRRLSDHQGSIGFVSLPRDGWLLLAYAMGVELPTTKSPQGMDRGEFNGKKQVRLECVVAHGAFAQHSDGKKDSKGSPGPGHCTILRHRGLPHVMFGALRAKKVFFVMIRIFF